MPESFAEALRAGDAAAIKKATKTDLHSHAYFGARIERVERWLGHALKRPPSRMPGLQGMRDYAASAIDPYLNNRASAEFVASAAVHDAIDDGVVLLGMSFDIRATAHYADGLQGFSNFVHSLSEQYSDHIQLLPTIGIPRDTVSNCSLMDVASEAITDGVFDSIDLYGDEGACVPDAAQPLYELARSKGLTLKAHVGEFGGSEEVRRTVEVLGLDEVQHGIAASESVDVMRWLSDNEIRLHVCPTSNVMLGAVSDLPSHPIRALYDHGVQVTVNTDDLMVFGQSVSDEYLNLFNAGVLTAEELDRIREASIPNRDTYGRRGSC